MNTIRASNYMYIESKDSKFSTGVSHVLIQFDCTDQDMVGTDFEINIHTCLGILR